MFGFLHRPIVLIHKTSIYHPEPRVLILCFLILFFSVSCNGHSIFNYVKFKVVVLTFKRALSRVLHSVSFCWPLSRCFWNQQCVQVERLLLLGSNFPALHLLTFLWKSAANAWNWRRSALIQVSDNRDTIWEKCRHFAEAREVFYMLNIWTCWWLTVSVKCVLTGNYIYSQWESRFRARGKSVGGVIDLQPMREQIQGKGKIGGRSYIPTANERADSGQGDDQWEES